MPGGPTSNTPRGMRAPSAWNRSGNFRNSTISSSSSFASGTPANVEECHGSFRADEHARSGASKVHRLAVAGLRLAAT